ncbi:hypothetical protein PtrSN002B_007194 [Pyrenophora tritici-repentis]|nr:hypothetical protein PtrSN002B_007194 [Pyrenophora tritici-repentis]
MHSEKISPATGKPLKKHEKSGLKFLREEQEDQFWEEVTYWNEEQFSDPKWKQVLRRIDQLTQEHNLVEFGWPSPSPPPPGRSDPIPGGCQPSLRSFSSITAPRDTHPLRIDIPGSRQPPLRSFSSVTAPKDNHPFRVDIPGSQRLSLRSFSSFTAPTGAHPLRPAHLPRIDTGSPTTPRPRWDVVVPGPVTPLSATAGPSRNAFAEGGFWASLTPKTSSVTSESIPVTPITAMPIRRTPSLLVDPESRAAYDSVNQDVTAMAFRLCANRSAIRTSSTIKNKSVHPSLVKPRDLRLAAETILSTLQYLLPDSSSTPVVEKLHCFAEEQTEILLEHNIGTMEQLRDLDYWMWFEDDIDIVSTILDGQRDALRMNRRRRKEREVALDEQAVRLAWAVKILNDKENLKDEDSDEDEGYEYGNIMRSLKNETTSAKEDRDNNTRTRTAQRSASSPIKPTPGTFPLSLRSRQATFSNYSRPMLRHPKSSSGSLSRSHAIKSRPDHLSINTTSTLATQIEQDVVSPRDRFVRHTAPSIEDLSSWANEIKLMERKRTEMKLAGKWNAADDAFRRQNKRFGGSFGESAAVGGISHPAFRFWHFNHHDDEAENEDYDANNSSSTDSWVCTTAKAIERDARALKDWKMEQNKGGNDEDEALKTLPTTPTLPNEYRLLFPPLTFSPSPSPPPESSRESSPTPHPRFPRPYNRHAATSHERRFPFTSKSKTKLKSPLSASKLTTVTSPKSDLFASPQPMSNPSTPRTINAWEEELTRLADMERLRQLGSFG